MFQIYVQHQSLSIRQNQLYKTLVPTCCRTNDGTQRFVVVPIAQSGSPQGQYQYAPNQTYPRNQNKANATSYVIPFPLSQVSVIITPFPRHHYTISASSLHHFSLIITPFQYPDTMCNKACLMLHQYLSCFHRCDFAIDFPFRNI